jgi:hypothetical protein
LRFYIRYFTLRSEMAQKGWYATGLLEQLWLALDPPTPDALAKKSGVHIKTIYSVNSGDKTLGYNAAKKLADATGRTIHDLGAPTPIEDAFATSLLGQIVEELERNPPAGNPSRLLRLADALRAVADRLEAVAGGQGAERLQG